MTSFHENFLNGWTLKRSTSLHSEKETLVVVFFVHDMHVLQLSINFMIEWKMAVGPYICQSIFFTILLINMIKPLKGIKVMVLREG